MIDISYTALHAWLDKDCRSPGMKQVSLNYLIGSTLGVVIKVCSFQTPGQAYVVLVWCRLKFVKYLSL